MLNNSKEKKRIHAIFIFNLLRNKSALFFLIVYARFDVNNVIEFHVKNITISHSS